MPKLLVLFHSRTGRTAALADAVAEGAKSVRFAEVDVRRVAAPSNDHATKSREHPPGVHRTLDGVASLADYDGVVLVAPARESGASEELAELLDPFARYAPRQRLGALPERVGSALAPAEEGEEGAHWPLLAALGRLGMILVPPLPATAGAPTPDAELQAARALGRRVATVVEWVAHARSHADGHGHSH
jgi:NAD(P)H dehydrogenase (quinone)